MKKNWDSSYLISHAMDFLYIIESDLNFKSLKIIDQLEPTIRPPTLSSIILSYENDFTSLN